MSSGIRASALTLSVVGGLALLYLPVLDHAVGVWRVDQEFTFGFLMPPLALVLLWTRRSIIHRAASRGNDLGLIALLFGLLLLVGGGRMNIHAVAGASFLPTVLGAATFLMGTGVARAAFLPVALVTASLSFYRGLLASLGFELQQITAVASAFLANLIGIPVYQSGVHLFVGSFHFVVTQACSGMDSLCALLCLGAVIVGLAQASLPRRLALITLVLPIILVANVLRVTLVLSLSQPLGLSVAGGLLHQLLSAAMFVVATLLFCVASIALRCAPRLNVR